MTTVDLGPIYTKGCSFRARAEARQREYRAGTLKAGWSQWGHWLDLSSADAGANFIVPEAFQAAKARQAQGKGVAERTFTNMLASQAMCFNLFAPLDRDRELAARVLQRFFPGIAKVERIHIEYTPSNEIFHDQSGLGGVDCDVLIESAWEDGEKAIITIETKFVEEEFSVCGFRKPGRESKGKPVCPDGIHLDPPFQECLYSSRKRYRYWQRTIETGNIDLNRLPMSGCPFKGILWQLWVNHTLAAAEAARREADHFFFGVCAPAENDNLLREGRVLHEFGQSLADTDSLVFIPVDELIRTIQKTVPKHPKYKTWVRGLSGRYAGI